MSVKWFFHDEFVNSTDDLEQTTTDLYHGLGDDGRIWRHASVIYERDAEITDDPAHAAVVLQCAAANETEWTEVARWYQEEDECDNADCLEFYEVKVIATSISQAMLANPEAIDQQAIDDIVDNYPTVSIL